MRSETMRYYRRMGELQRLTATPPGRWEQLRTWDILDRPLPSGVLDIADVGGATGVYAGPLAGRGHRVRLPAPVPLGEYLDDPDRTAMLLRQQRRLEAEPSLAGVGPHVMTVARR